MGSEWANYRVDDIANVTDYVANGSFATLRKNVSYSSTPDFAILVRLVDFNNRWNGDYVYLPENSYHFLKKSSLDVGDVIISNVGANAGTVFRVPDLGKPATLGPNSIVIKTEGKESLRDFLYYYFAGPIGQNQIQSIITGSAQPKFNKTDFRAITIKIPSSEHEQRAIVHILGSLDDKIELNRRINQTLEAMARAIFKSWFVDFDPVRAKAEGRPTGLPDDIESLFPDSFEDSELGEIPKGWEVGALECFATLKTQTVQPSTKPEKIWEHYSIPAFDEGKQPILEAGESIKSGKYLVPPNSVLASKLNPQFPRVWLPDVQDSNSSICSTEFMPFVPIVESWRPYLYEMLKSQTIQSEIIRRVTGSTGSRQRVKPKEIAVLHCPVPPRKLIDFFCSQVGPWHDNLHSNIRQSATLAHLRDTLLPKLISGELRVPDAEKFVEEAGL